ASLADSGPPEALSGDAGPVCIPLAHKLAYGSLRHGWSFDEANGPVVDSVSQQTANVPGFTRVPSRPGCGGALQLTGSSVRPRNVSSGIGVGLSVMVRFGAGTSPVVLRGDGAPTGSWDVHFNVLANSATPEMVIHGPQLDYFATSSTKIPIDQSWHLLEVS